MPSTHVCEPAAQPPAGGPGQTAGGRGLKSALATAYVEPVFVVLAMTIAIAKTANTSAPNMIA